MLVSIDSIDGHAHVVLSPHPDDAVLSCGGTIATLTARGERVLVLTACTASPPADAERNPLVVELHRSMNGGPELWQRRRDEDVRATQHLGADVVHAGLLDAPYRRPEDYDSTTALFARPAAGDDMVARIGEHLEAVAARVPGATLYAPLAIGGHVDHRAAHAAARATSGFARVLYYEDFPYVAREPAARETRSLAPIEIDIEPMIGRKIEAIRMYATQIALLFETAEKMQALVATRRHERFWADDPASGARGH